MARTKVPVSTRALIQRINRRLREDDEMVKATRGERAIMDLGDYYVLDVRRNLVLAKHVNLEELGQEVSALAAHEYWDSED